MCRPFALVLLLARGERSKGIELPLLRHELVDPGAAGAASAADEERPAGPGGPKPGRQRAFPTVAVYIVIAAAVAATVFARRDVTA